MPTLIDLNWTAIAALAYVNLIATGGIWGWGE